MKRPTRAVAGSIHVANRSIVLGGRLIVQTELLIRSLADDLTVKWPLRRVFRLATLAGSIVAALIFVLCLGLRPDVLGAAETVRFVFKFVVTCSLAITALGLVWRMAQPGAPLDPWLPALATGPALLLAAVVVELLATAESTWRDRLIGHNAMLCLGAIPLLSVGPLTCLLMALRHSLPTRPGPAGAVAGLAASGIAGTFYASHCPDDSPLFVAAWYSIATCLVAFVGFQAGRRLLRW